MKTTPTKTKVARVAVTVRLYFDVTVESADLEVIRQAALAELQCVEESERIRVKQLRFPALYPVDDWPALDAADFDVCDISPAHEVTHETRFAL